MLQNHRVFSELAMDVDFNKSSTPIRQKHNQLISFTFTGSPTPINIQYTESFFQKYSEEKTRHTGVFLYGEHPFKLFQSGNSGWRSSRGQGRTTDIQQFEAQSLPCTALISQIKQSDYHLNLVQEEPEVWSHQIEAYVAGDAYISYSISYQFDLKNLICICQTSDDADVSV